MANVVSTKGLALNKQWIYSSCVSKSATSYFDGRSASFFRISTDYCINP